MDDRLAVYIGAHPDDIDVGMSGSLFKLNLGRHPLMWVVVTDGGADEVEYAYESAYDPNSGRPWLKIDDLKSVRWKTPDGCELVRDKYSRDLAAKRCGIECDGQGRRGKAASLWRTIPLSRWILEPEGRGLHQQHSGKPGQGDL